MNLHTQSFVMNKNISQFFSITVAFREHRHSSLVSHKKKIVLNYLSQHRVK